MMTLLGRRRFLKLHQSESYKLGRQRSSQMNYVATTSSTLCSNDVNSNLQSQDANVRHKGGLA